VAASGPLACSGAESPRPTAEAWLAPEVCSQVHRDLARWLGPEAESRECGPDRKDTFELVPLGQGRLLALHRFSPPDQRWDLMPDGTVQRAASSPGRSSLDSWVRSAFTLLPAFGETDQPPPPLLIVDPHSPGWFLGRYGADGLRPEQTGVWPQLPDAPEPWDDQKPTGRQLIGLTDDVALDRNLGDGRVRLWRFVGDATGGHTATPVAGLVGDAREAFRRGHRLVPLGPRRLLEWLPVLCEGAPPDTATASCARFNVWAYTTEPAATVSDPFAPSPVSSGAWTDVGEGEDIVADESHLFVWSRATGRLRVHALDGAAADPLDQSLLVGPPQTLPELASLDWQPPTRAAPLRHLLVILQNGRSFDSYFGRYCQGAATPDGSPPACQEGAACCEGLPETAACVPLDDAAAVSHQPQSTPICMRAKMNGGAMDAFAVAHGNGCGDAADVACAGVGPTAGALAAYHRLAAQGALGDRVFQTYAFVEGDGDPDGRGPAASTTDAQTLNLLYLTTARFGEPFSFYGTPQVEQELARMQVDWAIYAGTKARTRLRFFGAPESLDPRFTPYRALERGELESDLDTGGLPSVAVVLPDDGDGDRSESPGHAIDRPIAFVTDLVDRVARSPRYREDTLVLLIHLTAGGFHDHVRPPEPPPLGVDATPEQPRAIHYGPRVPMLALGRFARPGSVSHVPMEISSITAFIEWNWLSSRAVKDTRVLDDRRRFRDTWANGIGSLLDPALLVPAGRP